MSIFSILNFPPELLLNILSFLPVRSLLSFSQTCRYSHSLASSSLHTLSLAIYTSRVASSISHLSATQYPQPKHISSFFSSCNIHSSYYMELWNVSRNESQPRSHSKALLADQDPYKVAVLIPGAPEFDPITLLTFHTSLTQSILTRHGGTLQNLELSLWTLTVPIARALSALSGLRALSIRIEDFPQMRSMPRQLVASQRVGQRKAWDVLTENATWAPRLHALRIEGGEISSSQLGALMRRSRWCQELWLTKCSSIGKELWSFLGGEWEGRASLRILGVLRCGGELDEGVLDSISSLSGLQFLSLHGCYGLDSEHVKQRNKEDWRIPEIIPPMSRAVIESAATVIEVDPLYMQDD